MKNLNEPAIIVGYRFLIAMCLWIWAGVGTLCAQKTDSDSITGKVHQIPDVMVSGKKTMNKISSAVPVQRLGKDMMEDLGIQNMADAVRRFAGTDVRDYGGTGGLKTVSVRNMGAAHTAISYDGVAVSNCQAGQIDIGRFSLDNVESLSLSVGQNEDMLQSARLYASAGVLNIETSRPEFLGDRKWQLLFQVKGGSFGLVNPYFRYGQQFGEKTVLSVDGDYLRSDGQYPFLLKNGKYTQTEKRNNSEVDSWHTEWNLMHEFKEDKKLNVKAYYYQSERGLPGAVILYNPVSNERLWDKNAFVQAKYQDKIAEKWSLQVLAKYNYAWNKYQDKGAQYEGGVSTDHYTQHEYYASGAVLYRPFQGFSVSLAQDLAVNTLDSNLPDCPFPTRVTSLTVLHARYQLGSVQMDASLINTYVKEHVETGDKPEDLKKLSPSFSINWRPLSEQDFFLRAMYKSTFRTPTFNDLYYYRLGNRSLRPEKAKEYNIGVTWGAKKNSVWDYLTFTGDVYFNQVTDKIVAFPSTYVWRMANYGKTHIWGADITLSMGIPLGELFKAHVSGSYTWQNAVDLTDPNAKNYKDQLPYTPEHNGNGSVILETPWIKLGYSLIGVGKRYYFSQNIPENEIEGYVEQTLTLSRQFSFKTCRLRLQADLINFMNEQYEVIKYYPMPGRSWKITAAIHF